MPRQYFIRLVLYRERPELPKIGVFKGAYELKRTGLPSKTDKEELESLLAWFEQRLPIPERFTRTTSKAWYRRHAAGLSWFKPSATEALRKVRELGALLSRHGYFVEELRTTRPGFVTYEDDLQVVAEPFAETPK